MGARGPVPKSDAERRRTNKPVVATLTIQPNLKADVVVPEPGKDWHDIAKFLYNQAIISVQAAEYEPSDYGMLWLICESISRDLQPKWVGLDAHEEVPLSGSSISAYTRALGNLLMTVGDRRRLNIENAKRQQAVEKPVTDITKTRRSRIS